MPNGEVINCPLGLLLKNVITRFNVLGCLNKKRYISRSYMQVVRI